MAAIIWTVRLEKKDFFWFSEIVILFSFQSQFTGTVQIFTVQEKCKLFLVGFINQIKIG